MMMHQGSVRRITDEWPIEPADISKVVVEHFRVMGIYFVEPMAGSELIEQNVLRVLKNSPELHEMIRKQKVVQESGRRAKALEG